jgi:hypothetical protein
MTGTIQANDRGKRASDRGFLLVKNARRSDIRLVFSPPSEGGAGVGEIRPRIKMHPRGAVLLWASSFACYNNDPFNQYLT